jgi:diadenosine tetraphosphatase ApaH/serine/threonine PP2A family protein phosphatase
LFQKGIYELNKTFESMAERICFVGHTHDLEIVRYDNGKVDRNLLYKGQTKLEPSNRYIINVGSVGQPRDGDSNAKYVLYDPEQELITLRYIDYDIASAAEKIIKAGLPHAHAERLG